MLHEAKPLAEAKPVYAVDAVDNALRLVELLWRTGGVRVSRAAEELGVGRSTAHRLLRMMVYRGFAVQREDRSYAPGPTMSRPAARNDHTELRGRLRPAMEKVNRALDETVHLLVREGDRVLFVDSVEARRPLRVGSRAGVRLPAELTSGGKALLAQLPLSALRLLYAERSPEGIGQLERTLARTRREGYGLNVDESEPGITAVGVCVPQAGGLPIAALTVSAPTLRFRRAQTPAAAAVLRQAVDEAVIAWPSGA